MSGHVTARDAFRPAISRREMGGLALLVAFAITLRCVRRLGTALMFNDGPTFLSLTQLLVEGRYGEAIAHPYHPLYPVATLGAYFLTGDLERAAAAVSILAGGASVALLFSFLRSAFTPREAWLGAALVAVQPRLVEWSADVQSDGLFLALFLAAVSLLWHARRSGRLGTAFLAGAATGLAYLTRPEGLVVGVAGGAWLLLDLLRRRIGAGSALRFAAVFALAAALLAVPYVVGMRFQRGTWQLSGKKPVTGLLQLRDPASGPPGEGLPAPAASGTGAEGTAADTGSGMSRAAAPPQGGTDAAPHPDGTKAAPPPDGGAAPAAATGAISRLFATVRILVSSIMRGLRPWLAPLLLLGILVRWRRGGAETTFVALLAVIGLLVASAQFLYAGYLDMRHVVPPLVPAFGFLGAGIDAVATALRRIVALAGASTPAWLPAALAVLVLGGGLGHAARGDGPRYHAERAAADWLRSRDGAPGALAAPKARLAWYAGRKGVTLSQAPREGAAAWLREQGARFIIVSDDSAGKFPGLRSGELALALRYCASRSGRWAAVYEIDGAADGTAPAGDAECAGPARSALDLPAPALPE